MDVGRFLAMLEWGKVSLRVQAHLAISLSSTSMAVACVPQIGVSTSAETPLAYAAQRILIIELRPARSTAVADGLFILADALAVSPETFCE
jgi:hypothetical protein